MNRCKVLKMRAIWRSLSFLLTLLLFTTAAAFYSGNALWYYQQPLRSQWRTYRQRQAESEKAYFRRLHQACLSNNPQTAFNQLMAWLDRIARESAPATLDELLIKVNDADFSAQIAELEQQLFSQSTTTNRDWSGEQFYQAIAQIRKHWLRQYQSPHIQTYKLQPLNLVRDIQNVTRT